MATPPDSGSGPRIRARARGGTSGIRPEVVDALGGLERSLSEVAKWEQMLAGQPEGGPVVPSLPEGYVGLQVEREVETSDIEPVPAGGLLEAARRGEDDGAPDDDDDEDDDALSVPIAPLLTEFQEEDAPTEVADASVLWAARTVEEPSTAIDQSEVAIRRRRRNARILSWAGAVILVAGAALWLVPDRSSDDNNDDELPALDDTSTTRSRTEILDSAGTTLAPVETNTPTTPTTTAGTVARSTNTTVRRASPTTQAPTPTTTPGGQLPVPGTTPKVDPVRPGGLPGPPTTSSTTPTTTPTTQPTDGGTDGGTTTGPTTG